MYMRPVGMANIDGRLKYKKRGHKKRPVLLAVKLMIGASQ